jgi:hypothetical protein
MGVDVQPRHPGSNPHRYEFGFLLFIKKLALGVSPTAFLSKKRIAAYEETTYMEALQDDVDALDEARDVALARAT